MDELNDIQVPDIDVSDVSDGASFDGLFDGLVDIAGNGGGMIGVIVLAIIGFLFYRKFNKGTKVLKKNQKIAVKEYKKANVEALNEIKEIDKKTEVILEELVKKSEEEEVIKNEISDIIIDTVDSIEKTKIENKRTITDANTRLRQTLERARLRRQNNEQK